MKPERWKQIRAVFEEAELLTLAERAQYLDRACAGDSELRIEVESLLHAQSQAGSEFMGRPVADLVSATDNETLISSRIGRTLGPYQIVAEIGHGGMGEVYRAVRIDGQFEQQVAIKLVRVGLGSPFIVQRFLHERQILATLNHPNIARLLDGGTTEDGVPYLVMELIEGDRIDVYCQTHRLSVTERLQLFLQVCAAVEYAHQRLVVHRDLKPGNILVTKDGTPELLDFGIAKILDTSGDSETTMARPMTPEYASPEQIRGDPITTATDVYSLGVVLYHLLTGRSPYLVSARIPSRLSHAIIETEPQRPSSAVTTSMRAKEDEAAPPVHTETVLSEREPTPALLRRRLSGDLDSILLMALRKEPELRYGSVQQFAADITRHLNGLTVTASRGSWSYTAGKFVARHRTAVFAASLVMVALVAGIAATEHQARIARMERAKAQKRFDDVRQFSNSLIFDIHDTLEDIPGTTAARNLLLNRAVQYLDRVAKDADGDPDLQRELALGYQRLATVQGDATVSNLGQVSASEASSQKATALFEAVARANPTNTTDQLNVAMIHRRKAISDVYYPDGRPEIERALAITDPLMKTDGKNPKVLIERAIELQVLATSFDLSGEREQSADLFRQSLELVQAVAQLDPGYSNIQERIAKTYVLLGFQLAHTQALDESQKQIEAGIAGYAALIQNGGRPDTARDLAQSRLRLGFVQAMRGDLDGASRNYYLARDAMVPLAKADPHNIMFRVDLLSADFELARLLVLRGRFRDAETALSNNITAFEDMNSEEDVGPGMGVLHAWLGEAQLESGEFDQAAKSFKKSADELEGDVQYDDGRCGIVTDYVKIGDALFKERHFSEAESAYQAALSKSDMSFAKQHSDLPALLPISAAHFGLGDLHFVAASLERNPVKQEHLHGEACDEYFAGQEISNTAIAPPLALSSSNFPAFHLKATATAQACSPSSLR
ncbi:MAG TPA: protein kinase [Terracidiphilus sp.]|nr:protein kinase [Terracidiphilus sp.]